MFITESTTARHTSLSSARSIQSTSYHPISLRCILMLSSHLRLLMPRSLFLSGFPTIKLYVPHLSSPTQVADLFFPLFYYQYSNLTCVGMRPLACWDCGFESHREHGCLSVVGCVLSGRVLYDELITRPEESYRLWCVVVCDLATSLMRRPWPALGCSANKKNLT